MINCYNHSVVELANKDAVKVGVKFSGSTIQIYNLTDGKVSVNTDNWSQGQGTVQYYDGADNPISDDIICVKQNLLYADASYKTEREKIQEIINAIESVLQGTATASAKRVQVGDKVLQYCSHNQLMTWLNYYNNKLRELDGKSKGIMHEKIYYRGGF